jgi:hypothetical protein
MAEALLKTRDQVVLDTYAQKTALHLNVAADAVRAEFGKTAHSTVPDYEVDEEEAPSDAAMESEAEPLPPPAPEEQWLARALLETDDHVAWIQAHLQMEWLAHPAVRFIAASRLGGYADGTWPGLAVWLSTIDDASTRNLAAAFLADRKTPVPTEAILQGERGKTGLMQRLRDKHIDRQLAALQQQLARTDISGEQQREILEQKFKLQILKRQPLEP